MTSASVPLADSLMLERQEITEQRTLYLAARPITFEEFLTLFGEDDDVELVDGVVVQKMAAQLEHEKLFVWLLTLLNLYVSRYDLGIVLGSRTAVRVSGFRGRVPDILFVRKDRLPIVEQQAIDQAPNLVIELVSPNDRPSDLLPLEADYRSLGIPEIIFIDQSRQRVRVLRRDASGSYAEDTLSADGRLRIETLGGVELPVAHLLSEPRPDHLSLLSQMTAPSR